jgi:hypothetical protein
MISDRDSNGVLTREEKRRTYFRAIFQGEQGLPRNSKNSKNISP